MRTLRTAIVVLPLVLLAWFPPASCAVDETSRASLADARPGVKNELTWDIHPLRPSLLVSSGVYAERTANKDVRAHPDPTLETYFVDEISVRGERFTLPFSTRLDERITRNTPSSFSDPMRAAIMALPGITPRDELFARPSVNGGLPDWTAVNYGGFSDCYPYVLYGTVSVASSQFDNLRLLKGAFPAEYGDALSGVVLVEPRRGHVGEHSMGFSLDLLRTTLFASGPLRSGDYGVAMETSFYDKVLGPVTHQDYPGSSSILTNVSQKLGRRELSIRTLFASGGTDVRIEPGEDRYSSASTISHSVKRRYELSLTERRVKTSHTTSVGLFTDSEEFQSLNGMLGRNEDVLSPFSADVKLGARSVGISHKTGLFVIPGHAVDVGTSLRNERLNQFTRTEGWDFVPFFNTGRDDAADTSLAHLDQTLRFWRSSLYVQDRCMLAQYRVTLGARYDAVNTSGVPALRASVERRFGDYTLRLAGGQYHRFPLGGTFREGNIAALTDSYEQPESAVHLLLGGEAKLGGATFSVDMHRQRFSHLVIRDLDGVESRDGSGELRAVDVTLSTSKGNQNFWAYATASFGETEIMGVPTNWDQAVVAKALCFFKPRPNLEFTTRAFFGSGLAYTPLLGRYEMIGATGSALIDDAGNTAYGPIWGEENSERLPAQFRLDVRVSTTSEVFSRKARFYLEGLNLTNHRNISGVDYLDYYSRTVYRTNLPRAANLGIEVQF